MNSDESESSAKRSRKESDGESHSVLDDGENCASLNEQTAIQGKPYEFKLARWIILTPLRTVKNYITIKNAGNGLTGTGYTERRENAGIIMGTGRG